jgi:transcriptional regulator with XRE-family HTH domain
MSMMTAEIVGDRIREARLARGLSLSQVATKAEISVATLSRIETNKQQLDMNLFVQLAKIFKLAPNELLGEKTKPAVDPMAERINTLQPGERVKLWKQLATNSRDKRRTSSRNVETLALEVEELLAQIDFVRAEVDAVRKRLRGKR